MSSFDGELKFIFGIPYIYRIFRSSSYIKVIGSRSRSQEQEVCLCVVLAGGLLSTERRSCYEITIIIIISESFLASVSVLSAFFCFFHLLPLW